MYGRLHSDFRRLPPSWRTGIKRSLGVQGHGRGKLDWLTARKDALGKKRLDRALAGVVNSLGPELVPTVAGKVCIDFGAGYVPTDGVALWILGADRVYGIDYNDIAKPKEVARAILTADWADLERQLETLAINTQDWRKRLDEVKRWADSAVANFPPGYTYLAPLDVIASPSNVPAYDLVLSTSVLEHIPPSKLVPLLDALQVRAREDAVHVHRVDLRDHRDFVNNPYGFLASDSDFDAEADADSRGNGMVLIDWQELLAQNAKWNLKKETSNFEFHLEPHFLLTVQLFQKWN